MSKRLILMICAAGLCVVTAGAALGMSPQQVSPAGLVEARCPTFSWSAVSGAAGYELLVYEVLAAGEVGEEPLLSVRLPGGAASWTPPGASCLAAGGRYAWTLRVVGSDEEAAWADPVVFEVAAAPSMEEVQAALATLRRHLGTEQGGRPPAAGVGRADAAEGEPARPREAMAVTERLREAAASRAGEEGPRAMAAAAVPSLGSPSLTVDSNVALGAASNLFKDGSVFLWDDTTGNTALGRLALSSATSSASGNTAIGRQALRNTEYGVQIHHGSHNTAVGDRALRSNTTGYRNTASGSHALYSNTTGTRNTASGYRALSLNTTASANTAAGYRALNLNTTGSLNTGSGDRALYWNDTGNRNTASGALALFANTIGSRNTASGSYALYSNSTGFDNTANGDRVLRSNTTGWGNTASGSRALYSNTTGTRNTAIGDQALYSNSTGSRNTAVGPSAGRFATTGSYNVFLGSGATGTYSDTHTIQIGGNSQNRAFIAGIRGVTTASPDAVNVLISSTGQLGTTSSSREVKQDLREVGELSRRLLELRPVAFRYKVHAAGDPDTPLQFGLIAEEVAEVFPELVVRDRDGRPETVKYHLLAALLLNELQRAERGLGEQGAELVQAQRDLLAVRARLTALEQGRPPERSAAPWWRRLGSEGRDGP